MILYVDLDAYFASVEQALNPELRGKPVVVGGDPRKRKGVVASASYEARKYGVHAAQTVAEAKRLCPDCIFVHTSHYVYKEFSKRFYSILSHYSPDIEIASLDEAYLDISGSLRLFGGSLNIARDIKRRIKEELGITGTVAVGISKIVSKIGAEQVKPDGLIEIKKGEEDDFIYPLPISEFPGIGRRIKAGLNKMGIETIGDLIEYPLSEIYKIFGIVGVRWVKGIHDECLSRPTERKSISKSHTLKKNTRDVKVLHSLLRYLTEKVASKLKRFGMYATRVSVKIRMPDFSEKKGWSRIPPTNLSLEIYREARKIFDSIEKRWVRLVGVRVGDLTRIPSLYRDEKENRFENCIEEVRERFGFDSVLPLACDIDEW